VADNEFFNIMCRFFMTHFSVFTEYENYTIF
jgi:hypothetical protein